MDISDRLSQLVKYTGLSPRGFALKIGTSSQAMGNYLSGRSPSFEVVCSIVETFVEISPDWLLTGAGPMLRADQPALVAQPPAIKAPPPAVVQRDPRDVERIAALEEKLTDKLEVIAAKNEVIATKDKAIADKDKALDDCMADKEKMAKYIAHLESECKPHKHHYAQRVNPIVGVGLPVAPAEE